MVIETLLHKYILIGAGLICVGQVGDWLSTHFLLGSSGGIETNPVSKLLVAWGWLLIVKVALSITLWWRLSSRVLPLRASMHMLCSVWIVAGLFACAVLGNVLLLI